MIATPFGSTAYYKSITGKSFRSGVGVAFNNPVEPVKPRVLEEDSVLTFELLRGHAYMSRDDDHKMTRLRKGNIVEIKLCKKKSKIIVC